LESAAGLAAAVLAVTVEVMLEVLAASPAVDQEGQELLLVLE
jgi:hypothetical protein